MKFVTLTIIALLPLVLTRPHVERLLQTTSFNYNSNGADWPGLCTSGSNQSPIDIDTVKGTCDNSMVFDITFSTASTFTLTNLAYQIQGSATDIKLYATDINGLLTGYTSQYFTFHAPAEHQIEGDSYDLEMQIVFYINSEFLAKGLTSYVYAIVSILFNVDDTASANSWISALNIGSISSSSMTLNMQSLLGSSLPSTIPYFTYQGSFTTPASTPSCAETVNWYVLDTIQTLQSSQLALFTAKYSGNSAFANGNGNNREIQDLNDRTVKKGGIECEEQFVYFFSFFILYIFINYFIFKLL